jgi:hypothetical protein
MKTKVVITIKDGEISSILSTSDKLSFQIVYKDIEEIDNEILEINDIIMSEISNEPSLFEYMEDEEEGELQNAET